MNFREVLSGEKNKEWRESYCVEANTESLRSKYISVSFSRLDNARNFLAKVSDIDFDDFPIFPTVINSPDFLEKLSLRDRISCVRRKIKKKFIFSLRHMNFFLVKMNDLIRDIDLKSANLYNFCRFMCLSPTPKRSNASNKLTIITWFRHVVICTIIESCDDIILCRSWCQHDDGHRFSLGSEPPTDFDPIHFRERNIENNDIIIPGNSF